MADPLAEGIAGASAVANSKRRAQVRWGGIVGWYRVAAWPASSSSLISSAADTQYQMLIG